MPTPTLRTWDRRYGLGPSRRSSGGHRRYDSADLWRLGQMRRLVGQGVAPAEAARQALAAPLPPAASAAVASPPAASPPVEVADRLARLERATARMDVRTLSAALPEALAALGVVWTWEKLVLPVLTAVTHDQERTGAGVEVEHLLSERVLAALAHHAQSLRTDGARPALLACAEEEQHSLPVHALAAALAEQGVTTWVLGARTPYRALGDAVRRVRPGAVFVWSQQEATGDPAPLAALPRPRPACRVVVGGPGWPGGLPGDVVRVGTLRDAVATIAAAVAAAP
ncbi:MerR family transcriptional regulator [Actinomadura sp. ATCC 31491]|uniref:MerR family transcriptional regulator n=1 Tax=Actinomadura luzonensis TaxID=2805427 RepID=A0ABT0G6X8_9ACTN|nr:MerR family transcriptional regulator [Actinomadura luzonensis]